MAGAKSNRYTYCCRNEVGHENKEYRIKPFSLREFLKTVKTLSGEE